MNIREGIQMKFSVFFKVISLFLFPVPWGCVRRAENRRVLLMLMERGKYFVLL